MLIIGICHGDPLDPDIRDTCPDTIKDRFSTITSRFGLIQHQTTITRPDSSSCLDLVFTNHQALVTNVHTTPGMSDHLAVKYDVALKFSKSSTPTRKIYDHRKADITKMSKVMETFASKFEQDWKNFSPQENWNRFHSALNSIMPLKTLRSKRNLPWINGSVRKSMARRDRLFKKARQSRSPRHWEAYKSQRNATTSAIKRAHNKYVQNIMGDLDQDDPNSQEGGIKRFWGYVKSSRKDSVGVPTLNTHDGPVSTDQGKADTLNDLFNDAFTSENLDTLPIIDHSPFPSMRSITFTIPGIRKLLENLKPHKAAGPDALPPRLLRDLAPQLASPICILFQQFYDTGIIPQAWRDAIVSPVHKKGSKHDPSNYRPVSLTSIICKLQEHIIVSSMLTHLEDHGILNPDQHGFRKRLSTETQLIQAVHDWASTIDAKGQTDVLFLDFSKAFDTVPHRRLLMKLQHYGIDGKTSNWIATLLRGRRQRVIVNGTGSVWSPVLSGVPQGTVIGPILFLIYINDITCDINSRMRLFADDSIIYREIRSMEDHYKLQDDITKLQTWSERWQMTFKPEKCYVLSITNKRNISKFLYHINDVALESKDSWKYLGVIIDSKLNWNDHCTEIAAKARQALGLIQRTLHAATPKCKAIAYKALVRPRLEYASTAWNAHTAKNTRLLESIQNNAARFVHRKYDWNTSVTALKQDLNWPTLLQRRKIHDLTMWYKIHFGLVNINFPPAVLPRPRNSQDRIYHELSFIQVQHRVACFGHTFYVRTIPLWNSLPVSPASATSLNCFQRLAATHCGSPQP